MIGQAERRLMTIHTTRMIQASMKRLFPNASVDQALVELLLVRAQKNLVKYRSTARQFESRYGQSFDQFRAAVLRDPSAAQMEQDYFDWELAVTAMADTEEEIAQLREQAQ